MISSRFEHFFIFKFECRRFFFSFFFFFVSVYCLIYHRTYILHRVVLIHFYACSTQVVASDKDSGDNARLTYTMKAAQGFDDIFSVEPDTGVIHSDHSFRGNQDFSFYVSTIRLYRLPIRRNRLPRICPPPPSLSSSHRPVPKS